jgi:hypothetical protein
MDRTVDVFYWDFTSVYESNVDPTADAVIHDRGDTDASGLSQGLQSRCDIYAVPINIVAINDDIAEVDPDAEHDARAGSGFRCDGALDGKRAVDCIHDATELDQRPVADQLYDATVVLRDRWIEDEFPVTLQRGQGSGFVAGYHAGIANHISSQDRGKPPICAHLGHGQYLLL